MKKSKELENSILDLHQQLELLKEEYVKEVEKELYPYVGKVVQFTQKGWNKGVIINVYTAFDYRGKPYVSLTIQDYSSYHKTTCKKLTKQVSLKSIKDLTKEFTVLEDYKPNINEKIEMK